MKICNIETKLGASKSYLSTAGSFSGFELNNPDLNTVSAAGKWGQVVGNVTDLHARTTKAASPQTNNIAGEPRSIPLSAISGLGRMKQYLPISLLGELQFVLITGNAGEVIFNPNAAVSADNTGDFSLAGFNVTYDVVVPKINDINNVINHFSNMVCVY